MRLSVSFQIAALAVVILAGVAYQVIVTYHGGESSQAANYLWSATFSFLVAWWIEVDRKRRTVAAPFEYAAFVFFLWPILAPHYLFKTRRWQGLGLGIGLILGSLLPTIAATITYLLFSERK
jgi:hypothetical protein